MFRHYAPQVVRQLPSLVRLASKRVWRWACKRWLTSLIVGALIFFAGFVYVIVGDAHKEDDAKRLRIAEEKHTIDKNNKIANDYANAWKASFLGDRQAVCFESYNGDTLVYTVACHIGAKGADPTKLLSCHEYGCEYTSL
jgi:hypothetical protein